MRRLQGYCRRGNKVCLDGPEFDGHLVNFDEAMKRQQMYRTQEGQQLLKDKERDKIECRGVCGGEK